jgi:hypothetical protein
MYDISRLRVNACVVYFSDINDSYVIPTQACLIQIQLCTVYGISGST